MRKLLFLALLGFGVWWLLSKRRASTREATVGYEDGSAIVLEEGAFELEGLVLAARQALQA